MKNIAIMGATGTIRDSTLSVISANPARYQVIGLTGFSRLDKLLTLCQNFCQTMCVCPPIKRQRLTNFSNSMRWIAKFWW